MKPTCLLALVFASASLLCAAVPEGKAQQMTSPEQVPEGLAKSDWASIRAAYEAGRHVVAAGVDGNLVARNPGQQWRTTFDGRGFTATPDSEGWSWGLELTSYGFDKAQRVISGKAAVSHGAGKVSYQWDENLCEWFFNDTRGMQQGWTFQKRPEGAVGDAPLRLDFAVRGGLVAQVSQNRNGISFTEENESSVLTYGGLKAWDADGKALEVRFEIAGQGHTRITVIERDARYPITIDPIAQQAYLKASNSGGDDRFGQSVAISGDTVVIGAPWEKGSGTGVNPPYDDEANAAGAAYVFVRNAGVWSQQAYLKASNARAFTYFGSSVAISGDTVIIGSPSEKGTGTGVNPPSNHFWSGAGAAYVFVRRAGVWSEQAYLKASNTESQDFFGTSVAVSGDTVVIGAIGEDGSGTGGNPPSDNGVSGSGAAYVFVRSSGVWSHQAYLKASNTGIYDEFGSSVAVSGDTVVIGSAREDGSGTGVNPLSDESAEDAGAAYVFVRNAGVWSEQAYLKASNTGAGNYFGISVAVSSDTVLVGALYEAGSAPYDSGAAYVFVRSAGAWSQQAYLKASNPGASFFFGGSVAVSGDTAVIGSVGENTSGKQAGAAYMFARNAGSWSQTSYLKAANAGAGDFFGECVAISGGTVIVGASWEDGSGNGVDPESNEGDPYAGAAYVFGLAANLGPPEIAVEQPAGTNLIDNTSSIGLGSYLVGATSDVRTFVIKNTGIGDLNISGVTKTTGTPGDFTVDTTAMVTPVAPGDTTTFTVSFSPSTTGARSTKLQIASNDANENPFDITLKGIGLAPEIAITGNNAAIVSGGTTPRAADHTSFGNVLTVGAMVTRTFTVANPGTAALHLTGTPKVQITGSHATEFTLATEPGTSVAAGGKTTFSITFHPQDQGLRAALVSVANDDLNENPYTFAISGTGVGLAQTITFGVLPNRYQADGAFALNATASSGLPVIFSIVSGPATLMGNVLTPTSPGVVKVRATQPGNASYNPATAVDRTFTVLAPAKLTLVDLSQIYNASPRPIRAIKGGVHVDAAFTYGTTNEGTPPTLVGSYPVKAVFGSETVTGKLVITKAPLQVIPENQSKFAGQANPALTLAYNGFLGSDNAASAVSKTPALTTTATATSPGGSYPITASGGTSANYSFVYQKGSLMVETFAGLYEVLLADPTEGNPAAKLEINVSATSKSFSGKLTTPTETSAIALAGALTTNVTAETASGSATVTRGKGAAAATYVATFSLPLVGDFNATAARNGSLIGTSSEGKRLLVLPRGQTLSHAGAHTMCLAPAQALLATTHPIPGGAGYATAKINATTGSMSVAGKLADGTPVTATLAADADAGYRLFAVPYANRTNSFLAGWLDLTPHPDLAGRKFVSQASNTQLAWSKLGSAKDTSYRGGFGILNTAVALDPWLPPTTPFSLTQRLGLLSNQMKVIHSPIAEEPLPAAEVNLPTLIKLSSTNAVSVVEPVTLPANSTNWKMTITPASGVFSGSFTISGTPGRKVSFAGALRQPPSTETNPVTVGSAYYLLPAKIGAPTNEITSGEIRVQRP